MKNFKKISFSGIVTALSIGFFFALSIGFFFKVESNDTATIISLVGLGVFVVINVQNLLAEKILEEVSALKKE